MEHQHNENCNHGDDPMAEALQNLQAQAMEELQFAEPVEVPAHLETQMLTMLKLQDQMNTKVNPEWRTARNNWLRAIWIECAELMDWTAWKWWKKGEVDIPQIQIEIVDIWHFGMSLMVEGYLSNPQNKIEDLAKMLANNVVDIYKMRIPLRSVTIQNTAEAIAHAALNPQTESNPAGPSFQLGAFMWLMVAAGMTTDDLYRQYIAKNVLNMFRQDNGYKEGTYQKEWGGREDNDHLIEIMAGKDIASETFFDDIYVALSSRYNDLKVAA